MRDLKAIAKTNAFLLSPISALIGFNKKHIRLSRPQSNNMYLICIENCEIYIIGKSRVLCVYFCMCFTQEKTIMTTHNKLIGMDKLENYLNVFGLVYRSEKKNDILT